MQHLLLPKPGAQLLLHVSSKNKSIKAGSIVSSYTQLQLLRSELSVHLCALILEEKKKDRRVEEKFDLLSSSNTLCESSWRFFIVKFVLLDIFLKIFFLTKRIVFAFVSLPAESDALSMCWSLRSFSSHPFVFYTARVFPKKKHPT